MSVQEPQNQFERESMEDEIEESQDSVVESPSSDSEADISSSASESIDVPAPTGETDASSEDSTSADESEEIDDVPALENMPMSSSDELPAPEPTEGPAWYVIHCYSGYENKVRHNLEQRIETMGMKDKIFDVVIPTQEEIEVKDGKRRTVERHIFPGYVLVIAMIWTSEASFVSIAIDAGGVATGPLANTFLLALAFGAASAIGGREPLVHGLGLVSLIALAPVLCVLLLGFVVRRRAVKES